MRDEDCLIPDPQVRRRYDITDMTLWRWDRNHALAFPQPIRISGRKYRRLSELRKWEAARAAQSGSPEA